MIRRRSGTGSVGLVAARRSVCVRSGARSRTRDAAVAESVVAAGFGRLGTAILAAGMSFLILDFVHRVERVFLHPGNKA